MYLFRETYKINYNNNIFQVLLRSDNKVGFLKVSYDKDGNQTYSMPSAIEFINLSKIVKTKK